VPVTPAFSAQANNGITAATTNVPFTIPASPTAKAGQLALAAIFVNNNLGVSTVPAGWTLLFGPINQSTTASGFIYYKVLTPADINTTATWVLNATQRPVGVMEAFDGVDVTAFLQQVTLGDPQNNNNVASTSIVAPAVTTRLPNELVVDFWTDRVASSTTSSTLTVPGTHTALGFSGTAFASAGIQTSIRAGYLTPVASSVAAKSYGTYTATAGQSGNYVTFAVPLPALIGPPLPSKIFAPGRFPRFVPFQVAQGKPPVVLVVTMAVETDTAMPVGQVKRRAVGIAAETDTAPAITRVHVAAAALETDTAGVIGRVKTKAIGPAVETDTSMAVGAVSTKAVGTATETDTAFTLGRISTRAVGVASETDSALTVGAVSTKAVGLAPETDTALTLGAVSTRAVGVASETDTAVAIGRVSTKAVGVAAETDTALTLGRISTKAVGLAAETDTAQTIAHGRVAAVNTATETDTAGTFGRISTRAVGTASETDTAVTIARSKRKTLGISVETDTATGLGRLRARPVGAANETDTALTIGHIRTKAIGSAAETDSAGILTARKTMSIGTASELDTAVALVATLGTQDFVGVIPI